MVRLGDGNLDEDYGIQIRGIDNHYLHPNYEGSSYYDVAVVILDRKANIRPTSNGVAYVRPICFPSQPSPNWDRYENHQMDVAG